MDPILAYINEQEKERKEIMLFLHRLLMTFPGMNARIAYNIPFYYRRSRICYINPLKGGGIELGFTRGRELSNAQGILEAKDRKEVAGITISSINKLDEQALSEIIHEAIILDETPAAKNI